MEKQKILVTSALPYVNDVPHLGNLIGCVLSADAFARFQRLAGNEVLFVLGTDEHGTTTEFKALEEGISPKELTDKYFEIHRRIYDWFNSSHDCFGRTSDKENVEITNEIFLKLNSNDYISEAELEQLYCEKDKKFLSDRFVEGACPHCGYGQARGDQCDSCGKLLDALELRFPKCRFCGEKPVPRKSTHLFIELGKLQPELQKWFEKSSKEGKWTENAVRTTNAWLKEGLRKRCITRDLKWGIPVPLSGFEDKVFYSWFDAPIGYIGITIKALPNDWRKWWKNPEGVKLYQFMAKDNIPFHTILFPASLIGARGNYTLLYHIDSTEYLNYEDKKFSKSNGTGVFGDDAITSGIPSDVWRFYLYYIRPEGADSIFEWNDFQAKVNNELIANFGNFVNRAVTLVNLKLEGKNPKADFSELEEKYAKELHEVLAEYNSEFSAVRIREALRCAMNFSRKCNQYLQEASPWNKGVPQEQVNASISFSLNLCRDLAILFEPFLPTTAENVWKQLNLSGSVHEQSLDSLLSFSLPAEHKIGMPALLFQKIEDSKIAELKEKFK
ncbi:MAG: methionine--tRNA ligase [archaeon]